MKRGVKTGKTGAGYRQAASLFRPSFSFSRRCRRHHAIALVLVLLVIVLLSLATLIFSRLMFAEHRGAYHSGRTRQVRLLAESGVESLRITLMKEPETIRELGGLYDNEDLFRGYIVTDGEISMTGHTSGTSFGSRTQADYRDIGRFSVIAPALSDDGMLLGENIRYGVEDESSKFNLQWLSQIEKQMPDSGRNLLLRLPGMTEEIADALLDWLDDDTEPREYGAEDEYYSTLDPPYYTKNGIPDSLDELLLVKGVTPSLLYGIDWNRNGRLDIGEPEESVMEDEFAVSDGSLHLGLIAYLTLDSRESNINASTGVAKVNINMSDTSALREALQEQLDNETWINYIVAYKEQTEEIKTILELVGGSIGEGNEQKESPFALDTSAMNDYLPQLYDVLTISDKPVVGRININQAPRNVLMMLAATDDAVSSTVSQAAAQSDAANEALGNESSLSSTPTNEIIEGILEKRLTDPVEMDASPEMRYPFWPYTHGIVTDFETMKKLEPYFCTQGAVFKAQVIGRFDEQSPAVRLEVWLDATNPLKPAKVIRLRELSELGPGFTGTELGVEPLSDARGANTR